MKKIILVAVAALLLGFSANAKLYVGGTAGMQVIDSNFSGILAPEVGYQFNESIAAGAYLVFSGNSAVNTWNINPYFRWTFLHISDFGLFGEASFGIGTTKSVPDWESQTVWNVGVTPGVSYRIGEHFSFIGRVGNIGYQRVGDGGAFLLNINFSPTIGVVYNF